MMGPMSASTWSAVDRYFATKLLPDDPVMRQVLQHADDAGLPPIQIEANQGRFLQLLARMLGARRILEVGTLGGFSGIWLARSLPQDGLLVTLELDPGYAQVAQRNFTLAGVEDRVDLRIGPALETLGAMRGAGESGFDLVFLDADKSEYPQYLEAVVPMMRSGAVLVADNVVRQAQILDEAAEDPLVVGTQEFLHRLGSDPRLAATALQTVGAKGYDGFALAVVR